MTRIIGGAAGGRRLQTSRGSTTRPTSDRVREALFSTIESWCGSLSGLRFLDLYAGSGAVGLEAWSRGAGVVTLVESDRRAASLIRDNARTVGARTAAEVVGSSVSTTLRRVPRAPYDVVFLDPPYPMSVGEVDQALSDLDGQGWLVPGAMVVVERSARTDAPSFPDGFTDVRERRYGETTLWYGHAAPSAAARPAAPVPEE
ncbi:16S rRNA (guanine(966)-N(2))-methyltransferase RsmD [Nocardioides aestuarii]|uniref:16S rRNA (Guanine(966)-N(2))-methyltransferase RsmD n=1 Tax=Nocardioides aestuarii TaxID=252231 RepID=A0ABW4TIP2_9ACTN